MAKDKVKKTPRPRAEAPRGFRDYFGQEVVERRRMLDAICKVYHAYGFDPLESSAVETVEALGKYLPDVDRPNEGVFAWQDDDETWLALRYDLTAPLARVYAQHRLDLPTPYRRYAVGPVWRNEKPGPGRFRQFYQCDADTVGTQTVAADAEICMMLADAFDAVGISRDDVIVRVNNRKVLNGVMQAVGVLDPSDPEVRAQERGIVMRAIDKFDRLGEEGVRLLLGNGRRDESGDFTRGAKLSEEQTAIIIGFLRAGEAVPDDQLPEMTDSNAVKGFIDRRKFPLPHQVANSLKILVGDSAEGHEGIHELEQMFELFEAQNYEPERIRMDPSVVRGLSYYTGPVFEAELTFEIVGEDGHRRQFGSVAGGGRYDDLVKRFTGQAVPATGISVGVDRLLAALRAIGRAGAAQAAGPVVILVMDRERMADYQTMCAELRRAGIRSEVFLGGGNMARQLKYADKRHAPVAIIEGGDERAAGVVQLKDLDLGARLSAEIETREEWREQPAQQTVARGALVAELRAMLTRAEARGPAVARGGDDTA